MVKYYTVTGKQFGIAAAVVAGTVLGIARGAETLVAKGVIAASTVDNAYLAISVAGFIGTAAALVVTLRSERNRRLDRNLPPPCNCG